MTQLPIQSYDPESGPPPEVIGVIEAGLVQVTRRVEFYEADATTRWNPDGIGQEFARLIAGGVSLDMNSDERRKLDITLENVDQRLRPNPNGGFWYDKVIKVFRGVEYNADDVTVPLAIIESEAGLRAANQVSQVLANMNFRDNHVLLDATVEDLRDFKFIVSIADKKATQKAGLLYQLWERGANIVTIGVNNTMMELPHYSSTDAELRNRVTDSNPSTGYWTPSSQAVATVSFENDPDTGLSVARSTRVATGSYALYGARNAGYAAPITSAVGGEKVRLRFAVRATANATILSQIGIGTGTTSISSAEGTHPVLAGQRTVIERSFTVPTSGAHIGQQLMPKFYNLDLPVGESYTIGEVEWMNSDGSWGIKPPPRDTPTVGAFVQEEHGSHVSGTRPTGLAQGAVALAAWPMAGYPDAITATIIRGGSGGFWLDFHLPNINGTETRKLLAAALRYMRYVVKRPVWETQIGEFYIDGIDADHFPHTLSVTGRDGTKKLINDKIERNVIFSVGSSLKSLIVGQLSLAGFPISKMRLSIGDESLGSEMAFDRGTPRWDIVKSALESFGYERFFDGFGNFVVRKYQDPSTSPAKMVFKTGSEGNLTSYSRSTSDSRIYNHVVVTSDPSDGDANPIGYFGQARVEDESVATHRNRIGNRTLPVEANWLSSDAECLALAQERLKVTALESYEMNFGSIFYPWMEVGEIVEILDPDALDFEPTRFLLDTLNFPFALGPMDGTAKRVTFVGNAG